MGIRRTFGDGVAILAFCGGALATSVTARAAVLDPAGDAYMVVLGDSVAPADVPRVAADLVRRHGGVLESVYREGFKGFSARLPALTASGMRRDARVASVEVLAEPPVAAAGPGPGDEGEGASVAAVEAKAPAARVVTPTMASFRPGRASKLRRVQTPAADRYVVVVAGPRDLEAASATIDTLLELYGGGTRGARLAPGYVVQMAESTALALSRDSRIEYVQEQSIEASEALAAAPAPRRLPGAGLRRVASPLREHYRVFLRASIRADEVDATVEELMRAYEGRRRTSRPDDPRALLVEMSETGARALSDDFRVELVEEQAAPASFGQ